MTNYFKLPTWADKDHVYAVVETPRGSRVKLEFDPKLGAFTLAKPLFEFAATVCIKLAHFHETFAATVLRLRHHRLRHSPRRR